MITNPHEQPKVIDINIPEMKSFATTLSVDEKKLLSRQLEMIEKNVRDDDSWIASALRREFDDWYKEREGGYNRARFMMQVTIDRTLRMAKDHACLYELAAEMKSDLLDF